MVKLNKTTKDVKTTVLAKLEFLARIYVDRKRQNFAKEFYDVPRFGALFWGLKRVAEKRKEFLRLCLEKMPLQAFPK